MNADLYVPADGWLQRADPRVKLALAALLLVLSLALRQTSVILLSLLVEHALLITSKIPLRHIVRIWKMLLPLIVMIVIMWPLFDHTGVNVLLSFGPFILTEQNLVMAAVMGLRVPALAFACFVLLFTTDQSMLVRGLVALGVPYRIGLTISTSLRYIPEFFAMFSTISQAQQARGLNLKARKTSLAKRFRAYIPVIIAVLIQGFKMGENVGRAMESRGLGMQGVRRSYYRRLRMRPADWAILAIAALCACSTVAGSLLLA
ncbi:MAG: energy-coupling factor transporter transmembrane protein EcfT [Bifidobacterium tibiigranuli]|jgi:energy-coupling factor transport system permease protein|uniref:energy-coupling factor transporter transmembrane component T family protein n=1 Tax=Bifidobacterium tibiigranuli TaxID=2172043 RepID=UPI00235579A0|nr:energy-coupling factor transporter transmembrane component T [Bifidobacterium tibiigranuli]MCH3975157.1 energy-coupling factor transporter transmembrane protein EcfT [Bifidobacterium tibiigranuli]MCH4190228.1 energy-coupling factor transporter transmembrane protein EcfT [Bifidobacterium tibiigranuli]MCH4202915.1 energy-coupling factor transporter transmembrane protein EcfT [Bifidobacterium tibiigranuli]MCH4274833.1 energy-coupling factor transporter transmembrane protein EcfT [Bifidobacteriu